MSIPQAQKKERSLALKNECWALRQRGWTQEKIAEHLKLTQGAVSQKLKEACEEYRKLYLGSVERVQNEQIAFLENVILEATAAWERSKETRKKKSQGKNGEVISIESQEGDPRYLNVALKAKEDIRKITGADAPIKIVTEQSTQSMLTEKFIAGDISPEEAQKLYQESLSIGKL